MFYLEYTDANGVKQWELQAQEWDPTRIMLWNYGVRKRTLETLDRLVAEDPAEWHGHELDDLVGMGQGGCIGMEGNVGPMIQKDGDMHPLRRAGEFEAHNKVFEAGRKAGAQELSDRINAARKKVGA